MSDPTPDKRCPRCEISSRAAKVHCDSPKCTWRKCDVYAGGCGATYEVYGTGSYAPDDWKE